MPVMATVPTLFVAGGLFAALAGLLLARTRSPGSRVGDAATTGRPRLRLASLTLLVGTFAYVGATLGWETGIPVWLCAFCIAGTLNIYAAALSRTAHAVIAVCAVVTAASAGLSLAIWGSV